MKIGCSVGSKAERRLEERRGAGGRGGEPRGGWLPGDSPGRGAPFGPGQALACRGTRPLSRIVPGASRTGRGRSASALARRPATGQVRVGQQPPHGVEPPCRAACRQQRRAARAPACCGSSCRAARQQLALREVPPSPRAQCPGCRGRRPPGLSCSVGAVVRPGFLKVPLLVPHPTDTAVGLGVARVEPYAAIVAGEPPRRIFPVRR